MNQGESKLLENLKVKVAHSTQIRQGVEAWRVIIDFVSDYPDKNRLIKEYYVWVTGEFLEDAAHLSANKESASKFALQIAEKRFKESGNQVPIENGISCSNKDGTVIINPKSYVHPNEQV